MLLLVGIAVVTFVVFLPALDGEFLNWDDDKYVVDNRGIERLDSATIRWSFTSLYMYNWHPLTWLSHAVDRALWDGDPWGHHLTSVALHSLNAALLFAVLLGATRRRAPAALVAALFALHPSHVESVAWISERKDVLSTFFWLLALLVYVGYVRRGGRLRYLSLVGLFVLGLLSKPMIVTLPFVLLLMDYWPLERLSWRAVREKIPLFALSAASAVVTVVGQKAGGAAVSLDVVPWGARLANAVYSYGRYLGKLAWPVDLVAVYPMSSGAAGHPRLLWAVACLLAAATFAVFALRRKAPFLVTGWLWYLGTLVPVIGLLQVGQQAMADRYSYVPAIGVFVMLAFAVDRWTLGPRGRWALAAIALSVLALLAVMTVRQTRVWRDSITLWAHNIEAYPDHAFLHMKLAQALTLAGQPEEGGAAYRRALELDPNLTEALGNLGNYHARRGEYGAAERLYLRAIASAPETATAYRLLAAIRIYQERLDDAAALCRRALELDPSDTDAIVYSGVVQAMRGDLADAIASWERALGIDPGSIQAHLNLATAYERLGRRDEAIGHYETVLRIDPNDAKAGRRLRELRREPVP